MKLDTINIGLAGFGNIGSNFYQILNKNKKDIFLKTGKIPFVKNISARNLKKKKKT